MRNGPRLADIARRINGDLHRGARVPLGRQDGGRGRDRLGLLRSGVGRVRLLRRGDGQLIDRDRGAVDGAGTDFVGSGDHALIEVEIAGRAGETAHRQGALALSQSAFH